MRDDLVGLLEKADLALGSAAGVIDEDALAPLIESVRAVRARLAYPEDVLVAALSGGTGSGKSSLFNAVVGEEAVEAGGIRPTTSQAAAAVPEGVGAAMDGYLDRIGVEERHRYAGSRICLIDLPDTDSVEVIHRHRVDRILPLVDVVVWVTDPEKYQDARLHLDYIEPMAEYAGQLVFVLNQVDRLDAADVEDVVSDLGRALRGDGIADPVVVVTSAAPPSGPPVGVDELLMALEAKRSGGGLYDKLLTDVEEAGRSLQAKTGTALEFDARGSDAVGSAVRSLADGNAPAASRSLTAFLDALVSETGGDTASGLRRLATDVPGHLHRIRAELDADQVPEPRSRWLRRRSPRRSGIDPDRARDLLTEAVLRPARAILAKRALAVASVVELSLEAQRLRQMMRR